MKKNIKIYLISFCIILLGSCNDYLDVTPQGQLDRNLTFEKQQGFIDAINGVYIALSSDYLFGHQLTYGVIEKLARNHAITYADPISSFNYKHSNVVGTFDQIWEKLYNVVANINSILDVIDDKKDLLGDDLYAIIKGEALAIRAYCHYTAVKLYAPDYNLDKMAKGVPYVVSYEDKTIYSFSTIEKVYEKILNDLNSAEELLKNADPAVNGFNDIDDADRAVIIGGGTKFQNRRLFFNYWAVLATKARVYMSMGNHTEAYNYAAKVINDAPLDWVKQARAAEVNQRDGIYYPEVISGINVPSLSDNYKAYFEAEKYTTTKSETEDFIKDVFDENADDYRYGYLFKPNKNNTPAGNVISTKYDQIEKGALHIGEPVYRAGYDLPGYYIIPLIKLGEMQLIAAEAKLNLDPASAEVAERLNLLRFKRGILTNIPDMSPAELAEFITKEFRRETYLEGQMFYHYKRKNQASIPNLGAPSIVAMEDGAYELPVPEIEGELND